MNDFASPQILKKAHIGLYIHWPFCVSKCPYCDFNSHVRENIDATKWVETLLKELHYYKKFIQDRYIQTIFFGGGTPSLIPPIIIEKILNDVHKNFFIHPKAEITLEANPNSSEVDHFLSYKKAGITRISIGIQSLQDDVLRFLGRGHTAQEGIRAIESAAQIFDRFSFDLIYTRPHQTLQEWQKELQQALTFNPQHISLYQLTIEPNTPFYKSYKNKNFTLPDEDLAADLYEWTRDHLKEKKLHKYEISNYALQGQECQHNMIYWRYWDFIGIGPGAHGRFHFQNKLYGSAHVKSPEKWIKSISNNHFASLKEIDLQTRLQECMMMSLRLSEGLNLINMQDDVKNYLLSCLNYAFIQTMAQQNYLIFNESVLKLTEKGQMILNYILQHILIEAPHG